MGNVGLNEQAVVFRSPPGVALLSWQVWFDHFPLCVSQFVSSPYDCPSLDGIGAAIDTISSTFWRQECPHNLGPAEIQTILLATLCVSRDLEGQPNILTIRPTKPERFEQSYGAPGNG